MMDSHCVVVKGDGCEEREGKMFEEVEEMFEECSRYRERERKNEKVNEKRGKTMNDATAESDR